MAKAMYVGVDDKARKVKKIYVGVDDTARKVKKGYIGVGGVARPFFSSEPTVEYYGTVTPLSEKSYVYAPTTDGATSVGDYAIFGKDVYSSSLIKRVIDVSFDNAESVATTVGNYAVFAQSVVVMHHQTGIWFETDSAVYAVSDALVESTLTKLSESSYCAFNAATTVGDYALFGGGQDWDWGSPTDVVDSYTGNLTKSTTTHLSDYRSKLAATTVGNYAIFGGGDNSGESSSVVDAYDSSLTVNTPSPLSVPRYFLSATTIGNYALFGGGSSYKEEEIDGKNYGYSSAVDTVDAYNNNLVRITATPLSQARTLLSATTIGNYAVFGGGSYYAFPTETMDYYDNYDIVTNTVDVYNESLVRSTTTPLSQARNLLSATTIGNYAIFGGGSTGGKGGELDNPTSTVDVYTIA